jgi:hypothetical protein
VLVNDRVERHDAMRAELASLRSALRALPPPPSDEAALRAAFRARAASVRRRPRAPAARRYWAAAAAVLALVGTSLAWLGARKTVSPPVAASVAAPPVADAAAFQPLLYAPGWSPAGAYSVVRVRIPLSSFALVPDTALDGSVEADLLIGEDGLARGIRFPSGAALGASAATNTLGESR